MKLKIFLSSVAAACLVLPAFALADPPSDQGQGAAKKEQAQQRGQGAEKGKGGEKGKAAEGGKQRGGEAPGQAAKGRAPNVVAGPQAQPGGDRGRQPQAQAAAPSPAPQRVERAPQRVERAPQAPSIQQRAVPTAPNIQREPGVRAGQQQNPPGVRAGQQPIPPGVRAGQQPIPPGVRAGQQQYQSQQQPYQTQTFARQAAALSLGDWRAPARGPERDRAGQQWRQQYRGWDQYSVWRQRSDWWRNDSAFRLFNGLRIGFFFVPERGYIALPRQYRDHHWREGEYLPSWFRRYTVSNYARYGLPRPPRGCVWVWLNGDVALIDRSDGYILDIARNVW